MKKITLVGTIVLVVLIGHGLPTYHAHASPYKNPHTTGKPKTLIYGAKLLNVYTSPVERSLASLVQGAKEADTVYAKAIVGINSETHIYFKTDGNFMDANSSLLEEGQTVEVLFTGPIQTSDPVQASAIEIIILK